MHQPILVYHVRDDGTTNRKFVQGQQNAVIEYEIHLVIRSFTNRQSLRSIITHKQIIVKQYFLHLFLVRPKMWQNSSWCLFSRFMHDAKLITMSYAGIVQGFPQRIQVLAKVKNHETSKPFARFSVLLCQKKNQYLVHAVLCAKAFISSGFWHLIYNLLLGTKRSAFEWKCTAQKRGYFISSFSVKSASRKAKIDIFNDNKNAMISQTFASLLCVRGSFSCGTYMEQTA